MKKILIISIVMAFAITRVAAQEGNFDTPAERAAALTDWMKENLQLSVEQVPQVQAINLNYANKLQELKTSTLSRRQKLAALKADDQAKDRELKVVLTSEQFNTYIKKKEDIKKKMKEKYKEKRG